MAQPATLKLRMSEQLREAIEQAAKSKGRSLNAEIVERLALSFAALNHRDILDSVSMISQALVALNGPCKQAVELMSELGADERGKRAAVIARALIDVQDALFAATKKLLTEGQDK